MPRWRSVPLDTDLFETIDETSLTRATAALENLYPNAAKGFTRFPGLKTFTTVPGGGIPYLNDWDNDLIAVANGSTFRIGQTGSYTDVTGVPVGGGKRVTFAKTPTELVMAAGGSIVRLAQGKTDLLSETAPRTTHIAYIDGYLVAIELLSERFQHCDINDFRTWNPLNTFAVTSNPDRLIALVVTPQAELLLCGRESIEQYEPFPNGVTPFVRRWRIGEGLALPYAIITDVDNATFGITAEDEIVRYSGQIGRVISDDIARSVEALDDKQDCWGARLDVGGQHWMLWQFPHAATPYGARGVTFAVDVRRRKWFRLYGWDNERGLPARWPGWSVHRLWSRTFAGLDDGVIAELDRETFSNLGAPQKVVYRSAPLSVWGEARIDDLAIRLKRGGPLAADGAQVRVRMRKDNRRWTSFKSRRIDRQNDPNPMAYFGSWGTAHTWQLEIEATDAADIEVVAADALVQEIGI